MDVNITLDKIHEAAEHFLELVSGRKVIAFNGEMGAGKTTFIHAICDQLKVKDAVSSPTFSIINQYSSAEGFNIYHLDLYRIRDTEEAINAGVEDCLYSGELCLVEWPEKAPSLFPPDTVYCNIVPVADNERKLQINL
jgi:tRNA threonylcarbamoyladenosine biosynthesis protein TsaE